MARQGRASVLYQLGSVEGWGLSKEEMFSLLGMRMVCVCGGEAGRDAFPLRCKLLLL